MKKKPLIILLTLLVSVIAFNSYHFYPCDLRSVLGETKIKNVNQFFTNAYYFSDAQFKRNDKDAKREIRF